jgi:hypothetical protein
MVLTLATRYVEIMEMEYGIDLSPRLRLSLRVEVEDRRDTRYDNIHTTSYILVRAEVRNYGMLECWNTLYIHTSHTLVTH